jgi:hypothetical protein
MSNDITLFDGNTAVPAHIAARAASAATLALAGKGASSKRISIEGGTFRMIVDGKEIAKTKARDMNIVIVRPAPATSRAYYDPTVVYQRGVAVAPLCTSLSGDKPDAQSEEPQASKCQECPQNIAGSGKNNSRACRFFRRLAVVQESDMEGAVYQLNIPATSLFGDGVNGQQLPLEAYAKMLKSNNVNVDDVVTNMEFDTDAATPKLTFSANRFLTPQELVVITEQGDTKEARQATGEIAYGAESTQQKKLAPVVEQRAVEETPVAEPTKKPKVVERDTKKINSVIDEWENM